MTNKVGFLGLGNMGKPMALNLIRAGYEVNVCVHHNQSPVKEMIQAGAIQRKNPKEVASFSDVVILCLPTPTAVLNLLEIKDGLWDGLEPGKIIIDTGTTGLKITHKCVTKLSEIGAVWLDAPISGGVWGAKYGTLTFMVGGDHVFIDQVRPILESMGKLVVHVGASGAGQATKLVNNLMACINTAAVSEAFALGVKAGVEVDALHQVISNSSGSNWVLENAAPRTIFAGNYKPGGRLRTLVKDLNLVQEMALELQAPLLLGSIVSQLHTAMMAKGFGDDDAGVIARFYEELLEVNLVSPTFKAKQDG